MAFGLDAGKVEIGQRRPDTLPETSAMWQGIPVLVVVLLGGFTINFLWCLVLNVKNRSGGDYVKARRPPAGQLGVCRRAGAIWCSQIALLKRRRRQERQLGLRRLDRLDVQHGHLQHAGGHFPGGMARSQPADQVAAGRQPGGAGDRALVIIGYGNYLKPTDGIIAKVDSATLVVRTEDDAEKAFPLDAKSVILLDGRPAAAGDLQVGQAVKVTSPAPLTIRVSVKRVKEAPSP